MTESRLYQRIHDEELSWRDRLSAAMAIPVGLATVLGGALALYARAFAGWDGIVGWWFGVALFAGIACFVGVVVQLVRAHHGYEYERIPFPVQIRDYEKRLRAFHRDAGTEEEFGAEFEEWLDDRLVVAADRNVKNDLEKSRHLHWSTNWLVWGLIALGLATPPFFWLDARSEQPVVSVEVLRFPPSQGVEQSDRDDKSLERTDPIDAAGGVRTESGPVPGPGAAEGTR